jgi:CubicO group peptidase (beta-lactamase class C family)
VEASLIPRTRSNISGQDYGYGWWSREMAGVRAFFAWGFGGQFIFVVPTLHLTIVSTSAATVSDDRRSHRLTVDALIERLVVAPISALAPSRQRPVPRCRAGLSPRAARFPPCDWAASS